MALVYLEYTFQLLATRACYTQKQKLLYKKILRPGQSVYLKRRAASETLCRAQKIIRRSKEQVQSQWASSGYNPEALPCHFPCSIVGRITLPTDDIRTSEWWES